MGVKVYVREEHAGGREGLKLFLDRAFEGKGLRSLQVHEKT